MIVLPFLFSECSLVLLRVCVRSLKRQISAEDNGLLNPLRKKRTRVCSTIIINREKMSTRDVYGPEKILSAAAARVRASYDSHVEKNKKNSEHLFTQT